MRLLRFLAVCLCVSSLLLLVSSAQDSKTSQSAAAPQASPEKQTIQPDQAAAMAKLKAELEARAEQEARQAAQRFSPPGDPGIILPKPSGAESNRCWSIITYHFSHEPLPRPDSVTTCTPENAVQTRRADKTRPKRLPTPELLYINTLNNK